MTAQTFRHDAAGCYPVRVDILCNGAACWWSVKQPQDGATIDVTERNYPTAMGAYYGALEWIENEWAHVARALANPIVWPAI